MISKYSVLLLALVPLSYTGLTAATLPTSVWVNFQQPNSTENIVTVWLKGKQAEIAWNTTGDLNPGHVNIPLNISLVNSDVHRPLAHPTIPDAKSPFRTTVKVPTDVEDGEYTLRVDGLDPTASWYSSTLIVMS